MLLVKAMFNPTTKCVQWNDPRRGWTNIFRTEYLTLKNRQQIEKLLQTFFKVPILVSWAVL